MGQPKELVHLEAEDFAHLEGKTYVRIEQDKNLLKFVKADGNVDTVIIPTGEAWQTSVYGNSRDGYFGDNFTFLSAEIHRRKYFYDDGMLTEKTMIYMLKTTKGSLELEIRDTEKNYYESDKLPFCRELYENNEWEKYNV